MSGADALKDVTAGTVSGICSKLLEYPFDTVKIRLQTDTTGRYSSAFGCFTQTLNEEGVRGIYRGVGSPIAGAMAENATLFWAYGLAQRNVKAYFGAQGEGGELSLPQLCACGSASGIAVSHVLSPVERVKCIMQTQSGHSNFLSCGIHTFKSGGLQSLYKGHGAMLLREIPGNAAWYGGYEFFRKLFYTQLGCPKDELPAYLTALAGALGGCAYWSAFFPADVVGNRLRSSSDASASFGSTFKEIYSQQGWRGLYKGWGVTMVRAFPANAAIFSVYEIVRKELDSF
eukprot:TRINITY_DN13936_c0_g1_i1.p1 TRINITY_DN13936_c0_g1~~TRINITY_DN13936_c0_g1_i1.p1  ORF type:complete len:287 (+),score=111.96 TRINITY_DN13936_c0_g1_i1:103-963(+)